MRRSPPRSLLVLLSLLPLPCLAAPAEQPPFSWPTIPKEELALKDDPSNPGASAILLYREVSTDDLKQTETHYSRIKILTDTGKKYADVQIPTIDKLFGVQEIQARTVQADGTALDFAGHVYDQLILKAHKAAVHALTFTLPAVRVGSIIEYRYVVRFKYSFPDSLKNPERYVFRSPFAMMTARWVLSDELFTRRAHFSLRPLAKPGLLWAVPPGIKPVRNLDGTVQLDIEKIPAFQREPFSMPDEAVQNRAEFYYVVAYSEANGYWLGFGERRAEGFDKFIGDPKGLKRTVADLVAPADSDEAKLRKLYARAQQIRYLSFEQSKTEKEERRENLKDNNSAEDVLNRGYASANEINLLFVGLARAAGFQASPVLVADTSETTFHSELPDPGQLGGMVAWVRAGGRDYYLDPATLYCPFNILPISETGSSGIRILATGGEIVSIPDPTSSEAVTERKAQLQLDRDGSLTGKIQVIYTGREALEVRLDNRLADEASRRKALERELKDKLPSGSKVELLQAGKWDQAEEPLRAEFNARIPDYGTFTAHRLILPLAVFDLGDVTPFQAPKRNTPVWFPYPYQIQDDITVQLPSDLKVEALPKPRKFSESFGTYETSCQANGGVIHFSRKFTVERRSIETVYYLDLKAFYANRRIGDADQIVLQGISPAQTAKSR